MAKSGEGRSRLARRAGLLGAVVGVAAAGVAAGVTAERLLLRRTRRSGDDDPHVEELFGRLPFDESLVVTTPDGVDLYVEVVEPADGVSLELDFVAPTDPEPTLVFVHGFCLNMGTFHFQRAALTRSGDYRMVFYDQPGHGRSGKVSSGEYTLEDLGEALRAVLEATVPDGPIVLIGHSMGGMTIMALAELYPEVFERRVAGVVFISTSAGKLAAAHFGNGGPGVLSRLGRPLVPVLIGGSRLTSPVVDNLRRASTDLAWLLTRRIGFAGPRPSPTLVSYVEHTISSVGIEVIARYVRAIYGHARAEALEVLRHLPVMVICGEHDTLTPLSHSEDICRVLPHAEMVVIREAGHVALLERPDEVNRA
ncbi:MAG: alpha/beta hydrolase, partial [Micromonosporaceae bacterium]|nr:alpha/beta hydrolase [Micromonosporaceae bacterium]